jgi:hypothetical protein
MNAPQGISTLRIPQPSQHAHIVGENCPWCDQPIPPEKFEEINGRIQAKERERVLDLERRIKEQVAIEKAQAETKARAEIENARKENAAALEKARQESVAKEAVAREEARKAAEAASSARVAAAEQAKKDAEQQAKKHQEALERTKQEATAKEAAAREEARKAAEEASAARVAAAEQAKKDAEQQAKEHQKALEKTKQEAAAKEAAAKAEQENILNLRLKEQRDALDKANTEAVNAERAKAFIEKLKVEEKLQEVTRQLQQKSAEELGEGAEVDLFEELKSEFPDDKISRVDKGAAGADIIHKVVHNGKICGCIIYDSKNRNAWRNDYVTKLRQDQLAACADHAILSTHIFPAGARQIHVQDGVLIANPARVIALVELLRKQIVQIHGLRLSNESRDQKTTQLYEFITSDRSTLLLDQIEVQTDDMLELDVKEKKAHDTTWKKRGELIRSVQRARADFTSEIDHIIGTAAESDEK